MTLDPKSFDWNTVVSVGAFFIASFALFVSWRAYARDESDLRLQVTFRAEGSPGTAFVIRITNHGRRPVAVQKTLLRLNSGKPFTVGHEVFELLETQTVTQYFQFSYMGDQLAGPLEFRQVEVIDTYDQKYIFKLSKIKKQIVEQWTPEIDWITLKKKQKPQE